jgi:hypothetical protein
MVFAASKNAIKEKLQGISAEIQGTDFSEIDDKAVLEKCNKI